MLHSTYGGSGAKRLLNCPAYIELSKGIPNHESPAALDGTCVHRLLERHMLEDEFSMREQAGEVCDESKLEITHDHVELAWDLLRAARGLMDDYSCGDYAAETTGTYDDDIGSTIDLVFRGVHPDGRQCIVAVDYKSGRGVQVEAKDNPQLKHNIMCLREDSDVKDLFTPDIDVIVGAILQPDRAGEIQTKVDEFTYTDVDAFTDVYIDAVDAADAGGQAPTPGDHCTFCPAAPTCPAKNGDALRALQRDPANLEILHENMAMVDDLKQWCKAVESAVYDTLEVGQNVEGWKLVQKRAIERWIDEEVALKKLRRVMGGKRAIVTEKLLSPTQMRKAAKGISVVLDLEQLTEKKSSGTTLAEESDKRDAVLSSVGFAAALASVK